MAISLEGDLVEVPSLRIVQMHGAGQARVKGMDGAQDLHRLVDLRHRCADQRLLKRGALLFGVARIAADEDFFQAADHGARAVGVGDVAVLHHCLDAQMTFNAGYRIDDDACHGSGLLLVFSVNFRDHAPLAYVGHHRVRRDSGQRGEADHRAHRIRGALHTEAGERGQMLVERAVVPEARLAATDASVAGLDGIAGALVPLGDRAGVIGDRAGEEAEARPEVGAARCAEAGAGRSAAHTAGDQSGAWADEDRGAGGAELRVAGKILGLAQGACPLVA